jgi:hypothetical protein
MTKPTGTAEAARRYLAKGWSLLPLPWRKRTATTPRREQKRATGASPLRHSLRGRPPATERRSLRPTGSIEAPCQPEELPFTDHERIDDYIAQGNGHRCR